MPPGKSVLLIDDSQTHAYFIERALRKAHPRIAVHHLTDGESAVAHLDLCDGRRPLPDLVLLDRQMPGGMDGFETLLELRRRAHLAGVPVLILTGSDDPEHVAQAQQAGADGYVIKPPDQPGYVALARQIDEWTPARSWRAKEIVRVSFAPAALDARRVDSPLTVVNHELAGSYPGGHLDYAAKVAQLPLSLVLDLDVKDHGVWDKRRVFVRVLSALGWTKPEIRLYFKVGERWLDEEVGKPLPLSCANRALALIE